MDSTQVAERMPGGYNTRGKVSLRGKRKRDKAQVKLRDRMRKKIQGSTDTQNRLQNSISKATRSVPPVMPTLGDPSSSGKSNRSLLFRSGYWRTQQERYDDIIHTGSFTKGNNRDEIPFQALMDRVAERRDKQSCDLPENNNNSLLTIRSYKRPTGPYAIQQQPMIKKMVGIAPLPRQKPERKGPYVLVLRTKKKTDKELTSTLESARTKDSPPLTDESINKSTIVENNSTESDQTILQPVNEGKSGKSLDYMKTWAPNLQSIPQPAAPPDFEDRGVTNYKLQLQQANKLAESRFQYKHAIQGSSVYKYSALPSIPTATENGDGDSTNVEENEMNSKNSQEVGGTGEGKTKDVNELIHTSLDLKARKSSASEILEVMEAKKKVRRRRISESDFQTLLKTRNRYTSDMRVFKDDLLSMRRLSIISEANSVASDGQGRASSAERAGSRASIASLKSVPSLEKIDEAKVVKDTIGERAIVPRLTSSPAAMYLIQEEETDSTTLRGADRLYAPPSSPISCDEEVADTVERRKGRENTSKEDEQLEGMRWIAGDEEYVAVT